MRSLASFLVLASLAASTNAARADIYAAPLPSTPFDNIVRLNVNVPVPAGSPVRAALVSGQWARAGATSTRISSETTLRLTHTAGRTTTTYISGLAGGTSDGAPYQFPIGPDADTWPGRPEGGFGPIYGELYAAPAGVTYSAQVSLSGTAPNVTTGKATLTGGAVNLLTDAVAPITGAALDHGTLSGRPTTMGLLTPGSYGYAAYEFTPTTTGFYAILGDWRTGSNYYDGYLLLYRNGFNPSEPLRNLIGLDDAIVNIEGAAGAPDAHIQGSSMFLQMQAGVSYTVVATSNLTFNPFMGGHTIYIAGGETVLVPAPGAAALLTLGLTTIGRRRR